MKKYLTKNSITNNAFIPLISFLVFFSSIGIFFSSGAHAASKGESAKSYCNKLEKKVDSRKNKFDAPFRVNECIGFFESGWDTADQEGSCQKVEEYTSTISNCTPFEAGRKASGKLPKPQDVPRKEEPDKPAIPTQIALCDLTKDKETCRAEYKKCYRDEKDKAKNLICRKKAITDANKEKPAEPKLIGCLLVADKDKSFKNYLSECNYGYARRSAKDCNERYKGDTSELKKKRASCRAGAKQGKKDYDGSGAIKVGPGGAAGITDFEGKYQCGNLPKAKDNFKTKFNFGCLGTEGPRTIGGLQFGPIVDLALALLRFLTAGVGIAVVISMISAAIQYSSSEGSAEKTGKAKKRIQNAIVGLLVYIFAFALFNFLVPGGLFIGAVVNSIGFNIWF